MTEPTAELLQHWHEFYLLVGTAAAALVALLFVAASIGAGILTKHPGRPTRTYMSPIAFHSPVRYSFPPRRSFPRTRG